MEFSNHMEAIQLSKIRAIGDKASELAAQGKEVTRLQVESRISAPHSTS